MYATNKQLYSENGQCIFLSSSLQGVEITQLVVEHGPSVI